MLQSNALQAVYTYVRRLWNNSVDESNDVLYSAMANETTTSSGVLQIQRKIEQLKKQGRKYQTFQPWWKSYISKSPHRMISYMSKGENKNFNCKAINLKNKNCQIECRHLADHFANRHIGPKTINKFSSIVSIEKIAALATIKCDYELNRDVLFKQPREGYYFDRRGLGQTLQQIITQLIKQQNDHSLGKAYMFRSLNHDMSILIFCNNEQSSIKLAFYDPNDTLRVRWLLVASIDDLAALSINDLTDGVNCYFPEDDFGGAIINMENLDGRAQPLTFINGKLNPSILNLLLSSGHVNHDIQAQVIKDMENLDVKAKQSLLAAKCIKGISGLFWALQNGHVECVKAYCMLVIASGLEPEVIHSLLAAKFMVNGIPGLLVAMASGHRECVNAYCKAVVASGLKSEVIQSLLAAKYEKDGMPGLFMALVQDHPECVKAYCEQVLASGLKSEVIQSLLAAKREDGTPGLFMALQKGHVECVKAYCKQILASGLKSEVIQSLLEAKREDGTFGLSIALKEGHVECIKAYCEQIRASGLKPEVIQSLLAAVQYTVLTPMVSR